MMHGKQIINNSYQYKVHYSDRRISAESYVAETIDVFKQRFKQLQADFNKKQVRDHIRTMLESKILETMFENYYTDPMLLNLPNECLDSIYWSQKLETSTNSLTKMGIGRTAVQLIVDLLTSNVESITKNPPWDSHQNAANEILSYSRDILKANFNTSVDAVENSLKPFKFEVESTPEEWKAAQKRAGEVLTIYATNLESELSDIKRNIGSRRLRRAMKRAHEIDESGGSDADDRLFSKTQLEKARQANLIQKNIKTVNSRLSALRSYQCSYRRPSCCPEIQMIALSEKLAQQAMVFIQIELLNEYFFQLPRDVDESMYYNLTRPKITAFAKENPAVSKHLEIQERRKTLEIALQKLRSLKN